MLKYSTEPRIINIDQVNAQLQQCCNAKFKYTMRVEGDEFNYRMGCEGVRKTKTFELRFPSNTYNKKRELTITIGQKCTVPLETILAYYMYIEVYYQVNINVNGLLIVIQDKKVSFNNLVKCVYPDTLDNTFMSKHRANVKELELHQFFTHWILSVEEMTRTLPSVNFKKNNIFIPYLEPIKHRLDDVISNQYEPLMIANTNLYLKANEDQIIEAHSKNDVSSTTSLSLNTLECGCTDVKTTSTMKEMIKSFLNLENTLNNALFYGDYHKKIFTLAKIIPHINSKFTDVITVTAADLWIDIGSFLNECKGKILVFNDVHLMFPSHRRGNAEYVDRLHILNEFINKNQTDIIVLFGGYEPDVELNIFSFVPSLKRKFMWVLN